MAREVRNILVNAMAERELSRMASRYLKGRTDDIGCGEKPYRDLIQAHVTEHVGIDYQETQHDRSQIDRVGAAYRLPAADDEFDSAICTAVLEHLEEPEQALRECYRDLKPGRCAIYAVPFIWHLHEEPRDFYRFSKYGLEYLFEKAGFETN